MITRIIFQIKLDSCGESGYNMIINYQYQKRLLMGRTTSQRDAILTSLQEAGRPLSVEELLLSARRKVARLGIATVYRNLHRIELDGQAAAVAIPGKPPCWEATPLGHHHHFLCQSCDRVFEVKACPEDISLLLPEGFVLENHDILLQGKCRYCILASKKHIKNRGI
jgi:Fur family ferric uptake transcriptional regulator